MCIKLLHRHTSINLTEEALILAPIQLLMAGCGCHGNSKQHNMTTYSNLSLEPASSFHSLAPLRLEGGP